MLYYVVPNCVKMIASLDSMAAGRSSSLKLVWRNQNLDNLKKSTTEQAITMPRKNDEQQIVLDEVTTSPGIGAKMRVGDNNKDLKIGGFSSPNLKSNQID